MCEKSCVKAESSLRDCDCRKEFLPGLRVPQLVLSNLIEKNICQFALPDIYPQTLKSATTFFCSACRSKLVVTLRVSYGIEKKSDTEYRCNPSRTKAAWMLQTIPGIEVSRRLFLVFYFPCSIPRLLIIKGSQGADEIRINISLAVAAKL